MVWAGLDGCMRLGVHPKGDALSPTMVKGIEEQLALSVSDMMDRGVLLRHHVRNTRPSR